LPNCSNDNGAFLFPSLLEEIRTLSNGMASTSISSKFTHLVLLLDLDNLNPQTFFAVTEQIHSKLRLPFSSSFHSGGCDLVLVDAPEFNNGQGLKIHVRTKIDTWFSYVQSVVVQIGKDRFEAKGGFTSRRFIHNGHPLPMKRVTKKNGILPIKVGGFDVYYLTQRDHISWKVSIHLPNGQFVSLRSIKEWMRVDIENPLPEYFGSASGLMGPFEGDLMLGRDGATILEDPLEFGQEWQVQEATLFQKEEGPQYPQHCDMPDVDRDTRRALREGAVTYEDADKACAHLSAAERDDCIYDVIASSDPAIAVAY